MKTADGVATRVFVDAMTHMPLMLSWTGPAGRGFGRGGQGRRGQGAPDQALTVLPRLKACGRAISQRQEARLLMRRRDVAGAALRGLPSPSKCTSLNTRAVNGIKLPHLITRGASGETNEEWVIKSYKINPNFKANTFTK